MRYKSRHKGREGLKSSECRMFTSTMHNGHRLMVYRTGTAAVKLLQKEHDHHWRCDSMCPEKQKLIYDGNERTKGCIEQCLRANAPPWELREL